MPYRKVSEYVERLATLKRDFMHRDIAASSAIEYFERIDELVGDEIEEETALDQLEGSFENDFY